jgi:hypothetical protein
MRILTILLVASLVSPCLHAGAQAPPMPRVRAEPCTGYCYSQWASCARVSLREQPDSNAPIAVTVDSGRVVEVVEGQVRTNRPGIVVVQRSFTYLQRLHGPDNDVVPDAPKHWRFSPGDTIYVVDEESDGDSYRNWVWSYRAQEDTSAEFWSEDKAGQPRAVLVRELEKGSWKRVRTNDGRTGWTQYSSQWTGTSYYDDPLDKCVAGARRTKP